MVKLWAMSQISRSESRMRPQEHYPKTQGRGWLALTV